MSLRVGLVLVLSLVAGRGSADEGMWTFDAPPTEAIKARYGFAPTQTFLDRLRLASVRWSSGGSGAFVSRRGLVLTNHHVGADCIHKLGKQDRDYMRDGFLALTSSRELRCPDLELDVLEEIVDVSPQMQAPELSRLDEAARHRLQKATIAELEKQCLDARPVRDRAHTKCEVVTLYHGAAYHRYRYRRYSDVRLVFSPEFQIAFFGGDPDNFEYPRYDLDIALFRVYADGKPLRTTNFLPWSEVGARQNELVFTSGNPGRTERLLTVAQLETLRDLVYPMVLANIARVQKVLERYAQRGAEEQRQAERLRFQYDNAWKAVNGYQRGLRDPLLLDKKRAEEERLRQALESKREAKAISPWEAIGAAEQRARAIYPRHFVVEGKYGDPTGSELFWIARTILRWADERERPSGERLREYRDSYLPSLQLMLFSPAPLHIKLEKELLGSALSRLQEQLGPDDPLVKAVLAGQTPTARAQQAIEGSRLHDVAYRRQLWKSAKATRASADPMLVLCRAFDAEARRLRRQYEDEVEAVTKPHTTTIGQARFAKRQAGAYPDATWTLRLSYGRVAGYRDGEREIPWTTDFAGLYRRAAEKQGKPPWNLPARWEQRRAAIDLSTPFNFISTNDIIGGNSGSPVVNQQGELVGVVFDGNLDMLPNNFQYRDDKARTVNVQSVAVLEAMRKVYDATALANELVGR